MSNGKNRMQSNELRPDEMRVIMPRQSFTSYRQAENLIRYITRTRKNEEHSDDCIACGGHGVSISYSIQSAIDQFNQVYATAGDKQTKNMKQKKNRHVSHEYYMIHDAYAAVLSREEMNELAYRLSEYYWTLGYQVIYGVHQPDETVKHYHIHFAVNMVNCSGGRRWSARGSENLVRSRWFNIVTERFMREKGYI